MSSRFLRGCAWCAVAAIPLLTPAAFAQAALIVDTPPPTGGVAFSVLDPDGAVRDVAGTELGARLVDRVRRDTAPAEVWTETMFSALSVVSSELDRLDGQGRLEGPSRHAIGALATIAVVDVVVDRHPELLPALSKSSGDRDPLDSPIERICACDQSGSRACGCLVVRTGPGSCNYNVRCGSYGRAFCSAVNLELCIAETVMGFLSPFPADLSRPDAERTTRGTTRSR